MDVSLPAAFGAGLLTLVTPCVLPMVPILLGILLGASAESSRQEGRRGRLILAAALFSLGFSAVFILLGLGASTVGDVMREHRTLLLWIGAGLLALFGLRFLGLLRIGVLNRSSTLRAPRTGHFGLDALIGGAVFGLGWTPCAGPILGSVLTLAATTSETAWGGALLLAAYSAGIALPLLVLAGFAESLLPRLKRLNRHLPRIERATGVLLLAGGLLLAASAGLPDMTPDGASAGPGVADQGPLQPAMGEATRRPRLVEFYARDCPSCARTRPAVEALQSDCTGRRIEILTVDARASEANRVLAARYSVRAVPTFVGLNAAGEERIRFVGERELEDLRATAALLLEHECAGVAASPAAAMQSGDSGCPETVGAPPWTEVGATGDPVLCGG